MKYFHQCSKCKKQFLPFVDKDTDCQCLLIEKEVITDEKPKCDYCGKQIEYEVFPVCDENWNIQDGIVICETCKFENDVPSF